VRQLRGWAYSLTNDTHLAEEAVQDTLVAAWRSGAGVRRRTSRWTWLRVVLKNRICDLVRRRSARARALPLVGMSVWDISDKRPWPVDTYTLSDELAASLSVLRPRHREALVAVYLEGASIAQHAAESGITAANARVVLCRARHALRKTIESSST